ncbi:MAG: TolC family protein [Candidatus Desantisbacteria bacterium]
MENDYDFKNTDSGTTLGVTLSQPLSPKEFLSNRRIFKDIKDDYNLSLLSLNRHKQDFMNEVINAYINLIRQEMSIEINQKSIKTQDELLTITNLKYKAGDVPRIDMIDLELQNKLDKMNMLTEKDNCRKAKKGFLKTLGLDKDVEFTISQDIKPLLDSSPPLIEAMNSAKDYQLIESKISLKRKEQTLKEAQLSKNIAVFMEAGCSSRLPFDSSEEKSKESRAGIKVEYKIYDNSSYKRAVILLQKEFEIEQDNFQEQGKNIEDEIKELYKEIDLIRQKKELLSTMEKISHDLLEAGKLKFNLGIISQSELNNIIERYNKTQKEMIESKIESFSIGIRLLTLTCGLVAFYSSGGL